MGGKFARWGYTFAAVEGGTQVTESWDLLPDGIAMLTERFGEDIEAQIEDRSEAARAGMVATLQAIKQTAEDT
jgi:hypothetical protein